MKFIYSTLPFFSLTKFVVQSSDVNEAILCPTGDPCWAPVDQAYEGASDDTSSSNSDGPSGRSGGPTKAPVLLEHYNVQSMFKLDASGNSLVGEDPKKSDPGPNPRFGLQIRVPVINNYGCWCYGGDSWPGARDQSGFGPVMDIYDDACKAHHMGFDCIKKDADAEGKVCHPTETSYTLKVSPQRNGDYLIECADEIEDDWCKRKVCMVDMRFVARHWKIERDGILPSYSEFGHPGYHSDQGSFDTLQCASRGGQSGTPRVQICCGDYPYRVWYDVTNGRDMTCCAYTDESVIEDYGFHLKVGELYNSKQQKCCADGIKNKGSQC